MILLKICNLNINILLTNIILSLYSNKLFYIYYWCFFNMERVDIESRNVESTLSKKFPDAIGFDELVKIWPFSVLENIINDKLVSCQLVVPKDWEDELVQIDFEWYNQKAAEDHWVFIGYKNWASYVFDKWWKFIEKVSQRVLSYSNWFILTWDSITTKNKDFVFTILRYKNEIIPFEDIDYIVWFWDSTFGIHYKWDIYVYSNWILNKMVWFDQYQNPSINNIYKENSITDDGRYTNRKIMELIEIYPWIVVWLDNNQNQVVFDNAWKVICVIDKKLNYPLDDAWRYYRIEWKMLSWDSEDFEYVQWVFDLKLWKMIVDFSSYKSTNFLNKTQNGSFLYSIKKYPHEKDLSEDESYILLYNLNDNLVPIFYEYQKRYHRLCIKDDNSNFERIIDNVWFFDMVWDKIVCKKSFTYISILDYKWDTIVSDKDEFTDISFWQTPIYSRFKKRYWKYKNEFIELPFEWNNIFTKWEFKFVSNSSGQYILWINNEISKLWYDDSLDNYKVYDSICVGNWFAYKPNLRLLVRNIKSHRLLCPNILLIETEKWQHLFDTNTTERLFSCSRCDFQSINDSWLIQVKDWVGKILINSKWKVISRKSTKSELINTLD